MLEQLTLDVLDAFGLPWVHLVGSSLGGLAALRSAGAYPERVSRVVLLACPAFAPGWQQPSFFKLLAMPVLGRLLVGLPPTSAAVRMSLRSMGHGASLRARRISQPMLDWALARDRDADTFRNDAAMIVPCMDRYGRFLAELRMHAAMLSAVRAPALFVAGADDPMGGRAVVERLVARHQSGRAEVLAEAGHLPWLDDRWRVAGLVCEFLTSPTYERGVAAAGPRAAPDASTSPS